MQVSPAGETEKRMLRLGLSMRKVKAIFVSHEHSDHINGIPVIAQKVSVAGIHHPRRPCLAVSSSSMNTWFSPFSAFETISIGALRITAFPKMHDASNPHSFIITCGGINVGIFTDIGIACENVVSHFRQCHARIPGSQL